MQFNLFLTFLAVLIGFASAQWGYGPRPYGGYGGYGPRPYGGYGGYGPRPYGGYGGPRPTIIEKTVIVRPGWGARV